MLSVDGQSCRCASGSDLPTRSYLQSARVNGDKFTLVFQVDVNRSLAIGHGKLRSATKLDRAYHAAVPRINDSGAMRIAVHHEYALGDGVVNNAVGILVSLCFSGRLQCLEVKNDHFALCAVGDEAFTKFTGERDTVVLLQTSDVPDQGSGVSVHDLDFRAMGDVNAARGGIYGDVIEVLATAALGRAEAIFLQQMVAVGGRS